MAKAQGMSDSLKFDALRRCWIARIMLIVSLFLLPVLIYLDYRNGYTTAMLTKAGAWLLALFGIYLGWNDDKDERTSLFVALVLFMMLALGTPSKINYLYDKIWMGVVPILFIYLTHLRIGLLLSILYYAILLISYQFYTFFGLNSRIPSDFFLQISLAYFVSTLVAVLYESVRIRQVDLLHYQLNHDLLTGIYNRRGLQQHVEEEYHRSQRYGNPFSYIIFDMDRFKTVNDRFGHGVGDRLLKQVADTIQAKLRVTDIFARWGGEEFAILLPETNQEDARKLAEKLRQALHTIIIEGNERVSASFGIAEYHRDEEIESLLQRADNALYEAKEARDCVVVSLHPGTQLDIFSMRVGAE